jgi:hypothetical protein
MMIPVDIQVDVRYTKTRGGDGFTCELALDYLDATRNPPEHTTKRHRWTLTGSQLAEGNGDERSLEDETRARYCENFLGRLRAELNKTKQVLIREDGRLIRRHASG